MTSRKAVLFYLAEDQSDRVSMDVCQWILEIRVGKAVRGQDNGYRGRAYVPSRKLILFRWISERGVCLDREGRMGLLALPQSFGEMCAEARAIGLARTVERLRDRTEELRATLAANPGAASIHEAIGQLLPVEQPTLTPCDGKRIISKYAQGGELLSPELFPMTHAMVRRLGSDLYEHWLASVLGNVLCGNADNHARPHCLKRHCTVSDNGTSGQPVGECFPETTAPTGALLPNIGRYSKAVSGNGERDRMASKCLPAAIASTAAVSHCARVQRRMASGSGKAVCIATKHLPPAITSAGAARCNDLKRSSEVPGGGKQDGGAAQSARQSLMPVPERLQSVSAGTVQGSSPATAVADVEQGGWQTTDLAVPERLHAAGTRPTGKRPVAARVFVTQTKPRSRLLAVPERFGWWPRPSRRLSRANFCCRYGGRTYGQEGGLLLSVWSHPWPFNGLQAVASAIGTPTLQWRLEKSVWKGVASGSAQTPGKGTVGRRAILYTASKSTSQLPQTACSAKKVQAILGHSSITMTMDVYGHLFESPEEDVALFEKMERDLMDT